MRSVCFRDRQPSLRATVEGWAGGPVTEWLAPVLSDRDAAAPQLGEAAAGGFLPDYAVVREFTRSLRTG
jgi:hypothetical protein